MTRVSGNEIEQATQEYEDAIQDPSAWDDDPAPDASKEGLSTQVTIRLDAELANQVRRLAREQEIGYTSLIREWVAERVEEESRRRYVLPMPPQVTYGTATTPPQGEWSFQSTHRRARTDVA